MRINLPLKLGIGAAVFFGLLLCVLLLWGNSGDSIPISEKNIYTVPGIPDYQKKNKKEKKPRNWLDDPRETDVWNDWYQLSDDEDNIVGDIVVYWDDKDNNGEIDPDEKIGYSAKVIAVDEDGYTTRVQGKEGMGPITDHHPRDQYRPQGPTIKRKYFRKKPKK